MFSTSAKPSYCLMSKWLQTLFILAVWFIDHLRVVTTSNYTAVANSHSLQFTATRTRLCIRTHIPNNWRLCHHFTIPCYCECRCKTQLFLDLPCLYHLRTDRTENASTDLYLIGAWGGYARTAQRIAFHFCSLPCYLASTLFTEPPSNKGPTCHNVFIT
jgi:hypothetical protein